MSAGEPEPSLDVAILAYGGAASLGAWVGGLLGLVAGLALMVLLRAVVSGPRFRDRLDENALIFGRSAREAKQRRLERERESPLPSKNPTEREGLLAKAGHALGATFGLIWLAAIAFGILAALLSPRSCTGGEVEQEYRQR